MNDAHIYCSKDDFSQEFLDVCKMYLEYFDIFGIEKYEMRLSVHDKEGLGKKYIDEPDLWIETENIVRRTLTEGEINFTEISGEAAFYGPKVDVQVWSAIGKEFTLATNQVDFAIPKRFGLSYTDQDGKEKTPSGFFHYNSAPRSQRGTGISGNDSYKPTGVRWYQDLGKIQTTMFLQSDLLSEKTETYP